MLRLCEDDGEESGPLTSCGNGPSGWCPNRLPGTSAEAVDDGVGDADDTRKGTAQVCDSHENLEALVVQRRADGVLAALPGLSENRGGLERPTGAAPRSRIVAASALCLPYLLDRSSHFSGWACRLLLAEKARVRRTSPVTGRRGRRAGRVRAADNLRSLGSLVGLRRDRRVGRGG
ncbi:hypothetical protein GCM10022630_32080 [Thermobifida alba]